MREVVLRVAQDAMDPVLDRVLPLVAEGVRERPLDRGEVELRLRAADLPPLSAFRRALGTLRVSISETTVSDDWRRRRLDDYRPQTVAGRILVRPPWAPGAADAGMIELVVHEGAGFGAGTHPTTRTCLELMLDRPVLGSFADLGCGSGVLAILAARLGWGPVAALDVQPASVAATRRNAAANGVQVDCAVGDLREVTAPVTDGFAANVPVAVHHALARSWAGRAPESGLVSGFGPEHGDEVATAYAACGLTERARHERQGWIIAELGRG